MKQLLMIVLMFVACISLIGSTCGKAEQPEEQKPEERIPEKGLVPEHTIDANLGWEMIRRYEQDRIQAAGLLENLKDGDLGSSFNFWEVERMMRASNCDEKSRLAIRYGLTEDGKFPLLLLPEGCKPSGELEVKMLEYSHGCPPCLSR